MRNLDGIRDRAEERRNRQWTNDPQEIADELNQAEDDLKLAIDELEWFYILLTRFCPGSIPDFMGPTLGRHYIDDSVSCVELVQAREDIKKLRGMLELTKITRSMPWPERDKLLEETAHHEDRSLRSGD